MGRTTGAGHKRLLVPACMIALAIASGSGWAQAEDPTIVVPDVVRQPSTLDSRLTQHYHLFVSILEESGFRVGQTDDPRALVLEVGFDRNPSAETVVAILWHQNTKLIDVRAAPAGAEGQRSHLVEPMVQRAAQRFESRLRGMRESIVISGGEDQFD